MTDQKCQEQAITYDEALIQRLGQFGPGQLRILCWASISLFANAAAFFLWIFVSIDPVKRKDWQCVSSTDAACQAAWQQEAPSSQDFCALSSSQWRWTSQDSVVAKFNLICSDAWKVQFTNSLMFMGAFVGSGTFGFICDRWGRRRPLFLATAVIAASVFASLAAPSYWVMAALRAVTGFGAAGQSHCVFLLSTEPVGPSFRGLAGICSLLFFVVGEFVMVALAFALPAWHHLVIAAGSINAAALLLYPLVKESARWLLSQGRTDDAREVMQHIAKANHSQLPTQPLINSCSCKQLAVCALDAAEEGSSRASGSSHDSSSDNGTPALTVSQVLRQRRMAIRLVVLLFTWFSYMLNYYGIAMGSGGIPGSIYMTFAIGTAAEVLALMVVAPNVDCFGRHICVSLGQLLGGAACVACAMTRGGTTQAALAAVGKFGCSTCGSVLSIYTAELLPTSCRSTLMGICTQAARVGSITAPFMLMLGAQLGPQVGRSQVFIPFLIFGCLAMLTGLLTLLMPETLGAAMPESLEDLTALQSAFTAKPWRHGCKALLAFMFRTKAASAEPVTSAGMSHASSTGCISNAADAGAHDKVDDGHSKEVADDHNKPHSSTRKVSWHGDDTELEQPTAEVGAVMVTVQASSSTAAGTQR